MIFNPNLTADFNGNGHKRAKLRVSKLTKSSDFGMKHAYACLTACTVLIHFKSATMLGKA